MIRIQNLQTSIRALVFVLLSAVLSFASFAQIPTYRDLPAYKPGGLVVKFDSAYDLPAQLPTGFASLDRLLSAYGTTDIRPAIPALKGALLPGSEDIERVYYVEYSHPILPHQLAPILGGDPHIEYAEPRYHFFSAAVPNDSAYSIMPEFTRVQAELAWDFAKGENGNVVVAIIDGGTDWMHEDLLANVWTNPGEIDNNGIDDDGNGYVDDYHGWNFVTNSPDPTGQASTPNIARHGTHVAGTAAAVTNNATGISSISWNCQYLPVNIANPNVDDLWSYFFEGIIYAAANGADVISVSGGSPFYTEFGREATAFAHANNALVVAAAGNDDTNIDRAPFYPANFDHVLSVGAVNGGDDIKAGFSNYGISVDVFAPGTNILSTTPDGNYEFLQGTSMATPMVSALASLVKTHNPNWSADQVAERIRVSCDDISGFNTAIAPAIGKGRINALRALLQPSPAVRIRELSITESGNDGVVHAGDTVDLSLTLINYLDNVGALSLNLRDDNPQVELLQANATVSQLDTDQQASVSFSVVVDSLLATGTRLPFILELSDGGTYNDVDFFALEADPIQVRTHTTNQIAISITNEGNIGWLDTTGSAGQGYEFNGSNLLHEAGLMIGTNENQVSDCVRGVNPAVQDKDFRALSPLIITSTGVSGFAQEGNVSLNDADAPQPTGLTVDMLSLVGFSLFPGLEEGLILTYVMGNPTNNIIDSIYLGLYIDYNLNADKRDYVRLDAARKMGVIQNEASAPSRLAAVKLLNPEFPISFSALDHGTQLDDGFTDVEKWQALRGLSPADSLGDRDVSMILSVGPLSLQALQSDTLGFVLMASTSTGDLQSQASSYQFLWNLFNPISSLAPQKAIDGLAVYPPYPNPFIHQTELIYKVDTYMPINIDLYSPEGRHIRAWKERVSPGSHQWKWNGTDESGRLVSAGIYQLVIRTPSGILHKTLVRQ